MVRRRSSILKESTFSNITNFDGGESSDQTFSQTPPGYSRKSRQRRRVSFSHSMIVRPIAKVGDKNMGEVVAEDYQEPTKYPEQISDELSRAPITLSTIQDQSENVSTLNSVNGLSISKSGPQNTASATLLSNGSVSFLQDSPLDSPISNQDNEVSAPTLSELCGPIQDLHLNTNAFINQDKSVGSASPSFLNSSILDVASFYNQKTPPVLMEPSFMNDSNISDGLAVPSSQQPERNQESLMENKENFCDNQVNNRSSKISMFSANNEEASLFLDESAEFVLSPPLPCPQDKESLPQNVSSSASKCIQTEKEPRFKFPTPRSCSKITPQNKTSSGEANRKSSTTRVLRDRSAKKSLMFGAAVPQSAYKPREVHIELPEAPQTLASQETLMSKLQFMNGSGGRESSRSSGRVSIHSCDSFVEKLPENLMSIPSAKSANLDPPEIFNGAKSLVEAMCVSQLMSQGYTQYLKGFGELGGDECKLDTARVFYNSQVAKRIENEKKFKSLLDEASQLTVLDCEERLPGVENIYFSTEEIKVVFKKELLTLTLCFDRNFVCNRQDVMFNETLDLDLAEKETMRNVLTGILKDPNVDIKRPFVDVFTSSYMLVLSVIGELCPKTFVRFFAP